MKDLNFFAQYQGKKQKKFNTMIYIFGFMGVVGFLIIVSLGVNTTRIVLLERSISSYNDKLVASDIQMQLKEVENINKQIDTLKQYDEALTDVAVSVKDRDNVSDTLLKDISSTVPSGVSFKNLDIVENTVVIKGISTDRDVIAELKHNLSQLKVMEDVYVNSIDTQSAVEGEYSFDIKCVLKDVG